VSTTILGIDVLDIPENYTPMGVYALIECLNGDGEVVYVVRHAGMDHLRRIGAAQALAAQELANWANAFEPEGDDE
jgi:hypothetical protein